MHISVVTPSFNMGRYLEDTIKSVLANLREGDEYFIVDGGSADDSVEIIKRYEHKISGWVSESDNGYAHALAKGFKRCSGDILCWINASDLYLRGAFDFVRKELHSEVDLIFGDDFNIDEENKILFYCGGRVTDLRRSMLYGTWTPLQESCFWKRDLYLKIGGVNPSLKYAADYDFFLRAAIHGCANYVPLAFSAFRRHSGQKSIAGAAAYKKEKFMCRDRELFALERSGFTSMHQRMMARAEASWRARSGSQIYRRSDVIGKHVDNFVAGNYSI